MPTRSPYVIEVLDHPRFCAMVLATDYRRPDEYLGGLETALPEAGVCGKIVFDLLLSNGNTWQRYFSADVDTEGRMKEVKHIREGLEDLASLSAGIFAQHLGCLDMSLLSAAQQAAVKTGTPLLRHVVNPLFSE